MDIFTLFSPNLEDIEKTKQEGRISASVLNDALDVNEYPRIEILEKSLLLILSLPLSCHGEKCSQSRNISSYTDQGYHTLPLTFFLQDDILTLISPAEEDLLLNIFSSEGIFKEKHNLLSLIQDILTSLTAFFLSELKYIHKSILDIQKSLSTKILNKELISLLDQNSALTYYSSALESNELITRRLIQIIKHEDSLHTHDIAKKYLKATESDLELFEDILIELRQAKNTAEIYAQIMDNISNTSTNITTNNVNDIMRVLTALNLAIMIPALIISFYGMNIHLPGENNTFMFLLVCMLCLISIYISLRFLKHKGWL